MGWFGWRWDKINRDEPLDVCTNLGFWFNASGWFGLSSACHAQRKKSKPPRQDEGISVARTGGCGAPRSLAESLPDLTGCQWQYIMWFLGVECTAPGGELILCASNQSKQNLADRKGYKNMLGFTGQLKTLLLVISHCCLFLTILLQNVLFSVLMLENYHLSESQSHGSFTLFLFPRPW